MGHVTKLIELESLWSLIQSDPALSRSVKIKLGEQQIYQVDRFAGYL